MTSRTKDKRCTAVYDSPGTVDQDLCSDVTETPESFETSSKPRSLKSRQARLLPSSSPAQTQSKTGEPEEGNEATQLLSTQGSLTYNSRLQATLADQTRSSCLGYDRAYEIDFGGGYIWVVRKKTSSRELFVLYPSHGGKTISRSLLAGHSHFVPCSDVLTSEAGTFLVLDYMNLSLVQIIGVPRPPTEQELLAIVAQVSTTKAKDIVAHF